MNSSPSISIIIPVYQVADFIIPCLQSVGNQEYDGRVECILVDDCGTDNSMELARRFIQAYQGSVVFSIFSHPCNKGLSAARNTGMQNATGDYLLFLDSDDQLIDDALGQLSRPVGMEPLDIIVGQVRTVGSDKDFNCTLPPETVLRGVDIRMAYAKRLITTMACNKLYRRQMLVQNGLSFEEGIIHEDELWSFQVYHCAQSLCLVGDVTYLYRIRTDSITTSGSKEKRIASLHTIACKMQAYAVEQHFASDSSIIKRIESFKDNLLRELLHDKARFKEEYRLLRNATPYKWKDYMAVNRLHIVKQLCFFHYALPAGSGAVYHLIWLRIERLFHGNKLDS